MSTGGVAGMPGLEIDLVLERAMARRRQLADRRWSGTSILVSLAIHCALLALGTIVVFEATSGVRSHGSDVVINFDAPGEGLGTRAPGPVGTAGAGGGGVKSLARSASEFMESRGGELALLAGAVSAERAARQNEPATMPAGVSSTRDASTVSGLSNVGGLSDFERLFATGEGQSSGTNGANGESVSGGGVGGGQGVSFAGLGSSTARSVVYAVDCSGPMVTSLPMVMNEVRKSVSRLGPTQKFGVVLFHREGERAMVESFAPLLVRATPSAQARLGEWLNAAEPRGKSSPLVGLESAIALKPDAVFLLSRSIDRSGGGVWDAGMDAILQRLDQLNPRTSDGKRPMLIQTIQFLDEDPTGTLQAIGEQHGTFAAGEVGGASTPGASSTRGYRVIRRNEELIGK